MEHRLFKIWMMIFIILTGQCECLVCPGELMQVNERNWCIWFVNSVQTQQGIQKICENQGGLMFPIEDAAVQRYLEHPLADTLIGQGIINIWLNYNVTSGATFEGVHQTYTNFDNASTGECGGINLLTMVWSKMDCSLTSKGVCYKTLGCDREISNPRGDLLGCLARGSVGGWRFLSQLQDCPPHSMFVLPYDICFWTTTTRKVALEGHSECMADGGGLAVIPNSHVDNKLKTTFRDQIIYAHSFHGGSNDLWVGLTDMCTEAEFVTFEGDTVPYYTWRPSQPNDPHGRIPQDCVMMRIYDDLYWHDKNCDELRISLCSKSLNRTTPPTLNLPCLTTTTVSPTTEKVLCKCPAFISPNDTTTINQRTEQIKKEMLIEPKNTSLYRRSLFCAEDPRPSATYLGVGAAIVLTFIGGLLILPDVVPVIKSLAYKLRPKQ